MTMALETVLARAGLNVGAAEFLTFVETAARKLAPATPDPAGQLTADQRDVLADVGLDLAPRASEETDAHAYSVAAHAVLAKSALSVARAAQVLGVDTSRIRHRLAERRLTGWKNHGEWCLPGWQFADGTTVPGLEAVLAALPDDQPALVTAAFMTTPQSDLLIADEPVSPRQWLLAGGDPACITGLATQLGTPA